MQTAILAPDHLTPAIAALKAGELVAFPTETVYGLGANGFDSMACQKIFEVKGRPQDNPLILHVLDKAGLLAVADGDLTVSTLALIEAFWPGPLTVVVRSRAIVPKEVRAGLGTVAVRAPHHSIARSLIAGLGSPIAAPSANRSGRPSPTLAHDVLIDLGGRIGYIIDGGSTEVGVESTVVDCTTDPVTLLRPGGISLDMLIGVVGEVQQPTGRGPHRAPGMKYRHYAPEAPVVWVAGTDVQRVSAALERLRTTYDRVAIIAPEGIRAPWALCQKSLGADETAAAHRLFQALRMADQEHPDVIVAVWGSYHGLGLAVANRIEKAAAMKVDA